MTAAWLIQTLCAYSLQVACVALVVALVFAALGRLSALSALPENPGFWSFVLWVGVIGPLCLTEWNPAQILPVDGSVGLSADLPRAPNIPSLIDWAPLVLWLVGIGVAVRIARLAVGATLLRRMIRASRPADREVLALAQRLGAAMGASAQVRLSAAAQSPATFGWFRPTIVLPDNFETFDEPARAGILGHELAHVKRRDWPWSVAEELLLSVLWFHPGVWWLVGRVRLARECTVDRLASGWSGSRQNYIDALLATASSAGAPVLGSSALGFSSKSALERRIEVLSTKEKTMSRTKRCILVALPLLAVLATLWIAGEAFPLRAAPQIEAPPEGVKRLEIAGEEQRKRLIRQVRPSYPPEARKQRVQGTVKLAALISTEGTVKRLDVIDGHTLLIPSAVEAVNQWKYKPTLLNGKPVEVSTIINVNYTLSK